MRRFLLLALLYTLLSPASCLYFYLEGSQTRCFLEDLPKDTLVLGTALSSIILISGQFRAEEWNAESNQYVVNPNVGIKITVDVSPLSLTHTRVVSPYSLL